MDTSDPDITFNSEGVCNHCLQAQIILPKIRFTKEQENSNLEMIASILRKNKQPKSNYHAVLGVSGGVDSSYLAYLAKKLNLNVLLVHCDNGWNSREAIENIKKIVDKTGFDLITYVIDWKEFRDIQRSFLKADVVDIELITDHANRAVMFQIAKKYNINYVLSGQNKATEHSMPLKWIWNKRDLRNLKAIHKKFGQIKLKSFPTLGSFKILIYTKLGLGHKYIEPLNNINYRKDLAIKTLQEEFNWEYYGGKHYESFFTKFYQAYILPTKFGIDKRKVHLSDLMRNGEITYDEAKKELDKPLYNKIDFEKDLAFFLKKLGFSAEEFDEIMKSSPKPHDFYPSDKRFLDLTKLALKPVVNIYNEKKRAKSTSSTLAQQNGS
jgi:N-acetyl sugar amidotransferase